MWLSQTSKKFEEEYARKPPFSNNNILKLTNELKEYENSGNINETVKTELKLASVLNKRALELKNFFRENNIESASDFDRTGTKAVAEEWLKSKGWWIPVRNDLSQVQDDAWRTNVRNSYGELYNYLPNPQGLLNIAYGLNTKAIKKLIYNSGINQSEAGRIFNMWKETNKRPIFNYPESERTRRAAAAENRRTNTGGKKRNKLEKSN